MTSNIASPGGEGGAHALGEVNLSRSKIIRRREVEAATSLSRSSIYRLVAAGEFPAPVKLSARAVGWKTRDVAAWLESRVAERDGKGAQ
jgi:prophage regulatory protein